MAIKRLYDTLVGATVNVNQLVDADTTSVTIQSGHKYYAVIGGTRTIANSTGTAISVTGGTDIITDLTDYFSSASIADYLYSLETATAGAGIAKLKEWGFLRGYQAFNAGSIESVEVTGKKVVGFNQWNEEWEVGGFDSSGTSSSSTNQIRSKNYCRCIGGETYYLRSSKTDSGSNNRYYLGIYWYDSENRFISLQYANNQTATAPVNAFYFKIGTNSSTVIYGGEYLNDICVNLSSGRNGEYEPYSAHTYDLGTDTLRGIFKLDSNNNLYADGDTKTSDGTVTRKYGVRAYQSGDESLADAITDGTNTVYKLATPTTEQSTPFTNPQICDPDGTEEYTTNNGVPVGHETRYQL